MNEVIWGEFEEWNATGCRVIGITKGEYIEVKARYYPKPGTAEFEVSIWKRGQSSGTMPTHSVIGNGNAEKGKQAAESLLREGLERF
jgi:hypothetical protein